MANAIQDPLDRLSTIIEGEKSPFVELTERMKETSKDVKNLNLSILDLAIALEKRAGVTKEKDKEEKQDNTPRALGVDLKADLEDFTKGFISTFTKPFKDIADGIIGKPDMPANVEKPKDVESNTETISPDTLVRTNDNKEKEMVEQNNDQTSKVLSDMVEVLIDMRDDKSQKQLLSEAIAIKKIITEQNKAAELPGGIEPNTEEAKQEDREKLAEAIARKLGDVMQDLGIGSGPGLPFLPNKIPTAIHPAAAAGPSAALAAGNVGAVAVGGALATYGATGMLAAQEEHRKAYSQEQDKTGMLGALSGDTGIAATILDANQGKTSEEIQKEQRTEQDKLKDAPWYTRLYGIGKEDYLKKLQPETPAEPTTQASLRKYDYVPDTNPTTPPEVTPKKEENTVGKILDQVSDQNTELKMLNMGKTETQMLAPIVSQQTINNTEQTMLAATPIPHSTANSFNKWQDKRSSYTD
jgi:hypothetical protein